MHSGTQSRAARRGFSVIEFIAVIAIIVFVIAMLLPAMQFAREAARRTQCQNNLRQISLAMHNYAEQIEVFPPGVVNDQGPILNEPMGYDASWTVQLLAYLDRANLAALWDRDVGVYAPVNYQVFHQLLPTYVCPCNQGPVIRGIPGFQSSYAGCYNDTETPIDETTVGVLTLNRSMTYEMIEDGTTHTIMVGEVRLPDPKVHVDRMEAGRYGLLGWASGTRSTLRNVSRFNHDLTMADIDNGDLTGPNGGFGSYHEEGAFFVFCDGSVRFVHDGIEPELLKEMANPADGQLPPPNTRDP